MSEPQAVADGIDEVVPGVWTWSVHDERIDFVSTAHAVAGPDGVVLIESEVRFHGEELAREPGCLADPAATDQVFERVDREEETALPPEPLDERLDLSLIRAAVEPPLDGVGEDGGPTGGDSGVNDLHAPVSERLGGESAALVCSGDLRRQDDTQDVLVFGERFEDGLEVSWRRLRRLGRGGTLAQAAVELFCAEVHVLAEGLVAEADVERNKPPVRVAL